MRIPSNRIIHIQQFFMDELKGIYEKEEIRRMLDYCFDFYLGKSINQLLAKKQESVSESELLKFNFAVKDLKAGKPIQYILGEADFYGLKLKVNEHVLIPRQETEELVHLIIKENKGNINILDIGTGSGCIAIALKKNLPDASLNALDVSEKALHVAKENAKKNKVDIHFIHQDILNAEGFSSEDKFDVIVSNPPYVRHLEKVEMHKNVLDYEPHTALFVEDDNPLLFYEAIAKFALKYLKTEGKIYFEINEYLAEETKELLQKKGFRNLLLIKDMNDKKRILRGNL